MTGLDVMNSAWEVLDDSEDPHELYPEDDMPKWINEGVELVRQSRPDVLLDATGALIVIVPLDEDEEAVDPLEAVLSIPDRWKPALVEWVLFRAFDIDSDDRRDKAQAESHEQRFIALLGS